MAYQKAGGGGIASDEVTATKAQVLAGYTALTSDSNDEAATGTLPLASVLADNGGTMTNNGAVSQSLAINGTYTIPAGYHNGSGTVTQRITTKAAATYTPTTSNQTIAAGQYLSGAQTIAGNANLVAANILYGKTIFGVSGSVRKYGSTSGTITSGTSKRAYTDTSGGSYSFYYATATRPFNCIMNSVEWSNSAWCINYSWSVNTICLRYGSTNYGLSGNTVSSSTVYFPCNGSSTSGTYQMAGYY